MSKIIEKEITITVYANELDEVMERLKLIAPTLHNREMSPEEKLAFKVCVAARMFDREGFI